MGEDAVQALAEEIAEIISLFIVVIPARLVADDPAVLDGHHPLGEAVDQLPLVGDHQHGGAQLVDALQQHHDLQGALGSRLPVGSSAMIIWGLFTRARAMATRCCSPPESSLGLRSPF